MSYNRYRRSSCFSNIFGTLLVMAFAGWFFQAVGITDALMTLELNWLGYAEQGERTQMMNYYLVGMIESQGTLQPDPQTGEERSGQWVGRFVTVGGIPVPVLGVGYGAAVP